MRNRGPFSQRGEPTNLGDVRSKIARFNQRSLSTITFLLIIFVETFAIIPMRWRENFLYNFGKKNFYLQTFYCAEIFRTIKLCKRYIRAVNEMLPNAGPSNQRDWITRMYAKVTGKLFARIIALLLLPQPSHIILRINNNLRDLWRFPAWIISWINPASPWIFKLVFNSLSVSLLCTSKARNRLKKLFINFRNDPRSISKISHGP